MGTRKESDPVDPTHADLIGCFAALRVYVGGLGRPPREGDAFTCGVCGRRFTYEIPKGMPDGSPCWRAGKPS